MAEEAAPAGKDITTFSSGGAAAPPSAASLGVVTAPTSRHEYLDSLVVPSADQLERIAQVQADREAQIRRQSHSRAHSLQQQMASLGMGGDVSQKNAAAKDTSTITTLAVPPKATVRPRSASLMQRLGLSFGWNLGLGFDEMVRAKAAILIQRHYRGYKTRRELKGLNIDANTRWTHALRELQYRQVTRPPRLRPGSSATGDPSADDASTTTGITRRGSARQNWKKATTVVLRAGLDQDADSDSSSDSDSDTSGGGALVAAWKSWNSSRTAEEKALERQRREEAKAKRRRMARTMGQQYFLEMIDPKHRYGANLRVYHEEWQRASTQENFFYWLDHGEGRRLDMAACPRERLDREQVRYLSREERQYYLVQVDAEGRLCWAKNGARIDTSEKWKDSVHGIVPADDPTPAYEGRLPARAEQAVPTVPTGEPDDEYSESDLSDVSLSDLSLSDLDTAASHEPVRRVHHISATTVFDALLRKSVQKNTWIFVADTSFRLYVGIKTSGTFQHSSFLQGTRISAAGLIRIHNGRVTSLSPLSGHYRPPASNFRAFVQSLKEAGVDTSHMALSKSYGVLVGLEAYTKARQRGKDLIKKMGGHGLTQGGEEAAANGPAA